MTDMYRTANGSLPASPRMGEEHTFRRRRLQHIYTAPSCVAVISVQSSRHSRRLTAGFTGGASTIGRQSSGLWAGRRSESMSRSVSGMLPGSPPAEPLSLQRSASAVSLRQHPCRVPATKHLASTDPCLLLRCAHHSGTLLPALLLSASFAQQVSPSAHNGTGRSGSHHNLQHSSHGTHRPTNLMRDRMHISASLPGLQASATGTGLARV